MSTQFYLWLKQKGEGCDYAVGCGERLLPLGATTLEAAQREAIEKAEYHGFFGDEKELQHAVLYTHHTNLTFALIEEKRRRDTEEQDEVKVARIKELKDELRKLERT